MKMRKFHLKTNCSRDKTSSVITCEVGKTELILLVHLHNDLSWASKEAVFWAMQPLLAITYHMVVQQDPAKYTGL